MPSACVVGGCSNESTSKIALHEYPSDRSLWIRWDRFVRETRRDYHSGNKRTVVCSEHFCEDDFVNAQAFRLGFAKSLRLKSTAVPSIKPDAVRAMARKSTAGVAKRRSKATLKLALRREARAGSFRSQKLDECIATHAESQDLTGPSVSEEPDWTDISSDEEILETSFQVENDHKVSRSTQVSRKPKRRSKGVLVKPAMTSIGVQCDMDCPNCQEMAIDGELDAQEEDTNIPETSSEDPYMSSPTSSTSPDTEEKYIVFQSKLLELFTHCVRCSRPTQSEIVRKYASCIHISQRCEHCHSERVWTSQPYQNKAPLGSLMISSAILFSGSLPAKVFLFFKLLNLFSISRRTYYRHQTNYLLPVVEMQWSSQQQSLIRQLEEENRPLTVAGDGRSDSPGHSAKYGSYTLMEQKLGKVIDIQTVQSNEVKGASHSEKEGLKRSIGFLHSHNLRVDTIITDRHPQVKKWVRENLPNTRHCYDIWHVAKGVGKKLEKAAASKDCDDIGLWKKSVVNHMYWCATSTQNNESMLKVAKWKSLMYHIQDIHTDFPDQLFPKCAHEELDEDGWNKLWLEPTGKAYTALEKIVGDKKLLEDISKLSSEEQTANLESFHSLLLHFMPKRVAFSWSGMRARHQLAALHFNENSSRKQASTSSGEKRYKVSYSKSRKFEPRVKSIPMDPTYQYAFDLLKVLLDTRAEKSAALREVTAGLRQQQPPPLADQACRVDKAQALADHVSRFSNKQL